MRSIYSILIFCLLGCETPAQQSSLSAERLTDTIVPNKPYDKDTRSIHIFVSLCDNAYQGIVPVSKAQGNGQNPTTNLYWGAAYGVKTFFKKSKSWMFLESRKYDSVKLERIIFQHKKSRYYLIADAYNGKYIKQCSTDFLNSSCGQLTDTLLVNDKVIGTNGNAELTAYIGHDGLMDFEITDQFINTDSLTRSTIILACYSKHFFAPHLQQANVNPLLWTSGLMAPEAYIIHDALEVYTNNQSESVIQKSAAAAYNKYQKCGLGAAQRLLVSGW